MTWFSGGNVLCLDLWGRNSGPFMQALHFSFGLGVFVATLSVTPFLEPVTGNATILTNGIQHLFNESTQWSYNLRYRRDIFSDINETSDVNGTDGIVLNSSAQISTHNSVNTINLLTEQQSTTLSLLTTASTTQKIPKRKPSKTDGSGLGNYESVHIKNPPPEDLIQPKLTTKESAVSSSPYVIFENYGNKTDLNVSDGHNESTVESNHYESKLTTILTDFDHSTNDLNGSVTVLLPNLMTSETITKIPSYSQLKITVPQDVLTQSTTQMYTEEHSQHYDISYDDGKNVSYEKVESSNDSLWDKTSTTFIASEKGSNSVDLHVTEKILTPKSIFNDSYSSIENTSENDEDKSENMKYEDTFPNLNSKPNNIHKHYHHKPGTFDNDTENVNTIFNILGNRIEKYGFSKIQFSYLIVGLFVFVISLIFLGFLCHNPRDPKSKQEDGQGSKKISNKLLFNAICGLIAIFFFLYAGIQISFVQLVLSFATHSNLSIGSNISIIFRSSFVTTRFAAIFFAIGFSPLTILIMNFIMCTVGTIILSASASHVETSLLVGTVMLGIGVASNFPTGILWIERYIHVSNKVAAVFVSAASLGELVCPMLIYRLTAKDPFLLMHSILVMNILSIITFLTLCLVSRHCEKFSSVNNNGYQLANQNDEEDDILDMSPLGTLHYSEHRALLNGNLNT